MILSLKHLIDRLALSPSVAMQKISWAKSKNIPPANFAAEFKTIPNATIIAQIFELYQQHLARNRLLDFDDILMASLKLFRQYNFICQQFHHVLVDEVLFLFISWQIKDKLFLYSMFEVFEKYYVASH